MAPETAILLALVAFLVGCAVGMFAATPAQGDHPVITSEPPLPPVLPPEALTFADRLREGYLDPAESIVDGVLGPEHEKRDALARAVARLAAEGWAMGVTDIRAAVVDASGLPAELIDDAFSVGLASLQRGDA